MKKTLYILFLLYFSCFTFAQSPDSLNQKFKIKKIHFGLEYGKSPHFKIYEYLPAGMLIKDYPFYKVDLGYNIKIGERTYFAPALGFAHEEYYYGQQYSTTSKFTYTATINSNTQTLQGTKNDYTASYYHAKRLFTTLSLNIFQYYSPFKNENLKTVLQVGCVIKPLTWQYTKNDFYHSKDSVTYSEHAVILSEHITERKRSKVKMNSPVDFQLCFSPGLLYNQKYLQHHFGLNFCAQFTSPNPFLLQSSGRFIRVFYFVYF